MHGKSNPRPLLNPWDGSRVGESFPIDAPGLEFLIRDAHESFSRYRKTSRWVRSELLLRISQGIGARAEEFAHRIMQEAGKPIRLARVEVTRAQSTFRWASEEARHFGGELIPLDSDLSARSHGTAQCDWFPRGPVLAISPFNFPLNLAAHKVAPALAAGCTVLLKPPPQAPGASYLLHEVFSEAVQSINSSLGMSIEDARDRLDPRVFQVFLADNEVTSIAIRDPRLNSLSFTGSDRVGWMLRDQAARKKVSLELGGDAAVIVHSDANLKMAAERCAWGAFAYAGQVCISVQRIFVHQSVFGTFRQLFLEAVQSLVCGDPALEATVVGPVIDDAAANRIESWISEARNLGAVVELEGSRDSRLIRPWVLSSVPAGAQLASQEVFGPVACLESYSDLDTAIARVNQSRFGLQAGIFTAHLDSARLAFEELEVGGVIINDVPTFRSDRMPYGGVKDSGLGREGVRYALEEFSERRLRVDWKG